MFFKKPTAEDVERWADEKKVSKLISALSSRDATVRAAAANALIWVADNHYYVRWDELDSIANKLLQHLDDKDPTVVRSVIHALGRHGKYTTQWRNYSNDRTWYTQSYRTYIRFGVLSALAIKKYRTEDAATRQALEKAIDEIVHSNSWYDPDEQKEADKLLAKLDQDAKNGRSLKPTGYVGCTHYSLVGEMEPYGSRVPAEREHGSDDVQKRQPASKQHLESERKRGGKQDHKPEREGEAWTIVDWLAMTSPDDQAKREDR